MALGTSRGSRGSRRTPFFWGPAILGLWEGERMGSLNFWRSWDIILSTRWAEENTPDPTRRAPGRGQTYLGVSEGVWVSRSRPFFRGQTILRPLGGDFLKSLDC